MKKLQSVKWMPLILAMFFLFACGGSSDVASSGSAETGTLSLAMVDASDESFEAVYVTIKQIQVCHETGFADGDEDATCEWETIATLEKTYDLLTLVDGVMATLGQKELVPGTYNQMRLILGLTPDDSENILGNSHPYPQYLIRSDGDLSEDDLYPLKVPSGYNSGIKLVSQFEIIENLTTELILDFDVNRSIHLAGKIDKNGKYILKPTIKVIGTHNKAEVTGIITSDDDVPIAIEGATVSAWRIVNGNLTAATSTQTNSEGAYTLYLDLGGDLELGPENYLLVATQNGYDPACANLTVEVDQTYVQDFILTENTDITISGTIIGNILPENLPEGETYPTVHLSFKQIGECFPNPIEVAFQDIGDGDNYATTDPTIGNFSYAYEITVPAGFYDVMASTEGLTAAEYSNIDATTATTLDISF